MYSFITGPLNVTRECSSFADALTECALAIATVDHRAGAIEYQGTTVATMGTNGIAFPTPALTFSERYSLDAHNEAVIDAARAARTPSIPLESERV